MHLTSRRVFATLTLALTTTLCCAQTPTSPVEIVRKNPGYQHAVEAVAQQYENSLRTHCASVALDWAGAKVHVALAPTVVQDHIVSGVWLETVPGEACGQHRQYNALTVFHDGKPAVMPLIPGESESNALLQRDTMSYLSSALIGRGVLPKGCRVDALETQLPDGRPQEGQPWKERWLADACGKTYWVMVSYVPDATGTTINVSSKDVVPAS